MLEEGEIEMFIWGILVAVVIAVAFVMVFWFLMRGGESEECRQREMWMRVLQDGVLERAIGVLDGVEYEYKRKISRLARDLDRDLARLKRLKEDRE